MRASQLPRACGAALVVVCALAPAGCRPRGDRAAVAVDAGGVDLAAPDRRSHYRYPAAPGSFVDLVADAAPAVVAIRATTPVKSGPAAMYPGARDGNQPDDVALGTGFLIEHRGTFVLTNDHIAGAAPELEVILADGASARATIIGRDATLDVALLQIDVPRLPTLRLGDSAELQVGEWLLVLGNPFGDEVIASAGIVQATGRQTAASLYTGTAALYRSYLQTDADIHRGNSGGPVLDTSGAVVGLAVAPGDRPGELGFAVPVDRIREILDALHDHGAVARAYLGALVQKVTPELVQRLGLPGPTGAIITEVHAASPAIRAGLRAGDVILEWDGKPVDHRSLPGAVAMTTIGKKVNVAVFRSGGTIVLPIVVDKAPN